MSAQPVSYAGTLSTRSGDAASQVNRGSADVAGAGDGDHGSRGAALAETGAAAAATCNTSAAVLELSAARARDQRGVPALALSICHAQRSELMAQRAVHRRESVDAAREATPPLP